MRVIRVLVVGDVRLNREGVASLLRRDERLDVTSQAPERARRPVDVVVIDTVDGQREAMIRMLEIVDAPIVVLGAPDEDEHVIALAELGVLGFVEREGSLDELLEGIVGAARGEAQIPPRIATLLLRRVGSWRARRASADATALTMREREVVQLIAEGLANKEIAARLCIEVATVKNHVHNILEKLEVSRRADAVARLRIVDSDATVHSITAARSTT